MIHMHSLLNLQMYQQGGRSLKVTIDKASKNTNTKLVNIVRENPIKIIGSIFFIFLFIVISSLKVSAIESWNKYSNNPIFVTSNSALDTFIMKNSSNYKMWYA